MFLVQSYFLRPEPDTQICGIVIILDLLDLSLRQALRITPRFCKALVEFLQEGIGLRLKGYHVVNQSKIVDMLFAMTRPFIAEKYLKRIYFHGKDWSALHKHVSAECLPEAYGGTLKSAEQSYGPQFYELYKHYESDFERFAQYGYK